MKNIFVLFFFIQYNFILSQDKKECAVSYLNMTSLSITKNTESYFSNYMNNDEKKSNGSSFDLNTIHGLVFWDLIALSTGVSIDYNIKETFLATPILFDIRVFSNQDRDNCLFAYLQTGKNIKWSDSFDGNGTTSKLGVGLIFSEDEKISYYVDLFKKSKDIELIKYRDKGSYKITAFGLSFGMIF
jgi:hypothetical protein